ncbi:LADA_0H08064g1_1 [Lachancea dasiensis]|uniref:RING-type E3 ubiquitin transferase n=1 Tax=Lachancea dasiensis TaxID=1072105 RepID=A0A1G4K2C7_9SACH|nr:LADA_0H08064g1_1 [Lachancea dasiensis]
MDQSGPGVSSLNENMGVPNGASCRICRGDHTEETPLFHPCKCRGSIKYIHEGCLMEWVASKNVDLSRPGSEIKCDICHYPIQLSTVYDANTPDRVPISLVIRTTIAVLLRKVQHTLCITLAAVLLVVGVPLTWNFLGKLTAMVLFGGKLPISGQFFKSVLFGFESDVPDKVSDLDIVIQLLKNYRFSVAQIIFVAIIHIALYFQYDMVVREAIFNKMVFHKIGPRFSKEELMTEKLKQQFPGMDENTIHHIVQLMRARERPADPNQEEHFDENPVEGVRENDNNANEGENGEGLGVEINRDNRVATADYQEPESSTGQSVQEARNAEGENFGHVDDEDDDEDDGDYVPSDALSSRSSSSSIISSDHEPNDEERGQLLEDADPVRVFQQRRAVNELEELLGAQQPNLPEGQPHNIAFMEVPNEPVADAAEINEALNQQDGPAVLGLHLRFRNIPFYFLATTIFLALYLYLAYAIPTFVGNLLQGAYWFACSWGLRGIIQLAKLARVPALYAEATRRYPPIDTWMSWSLSRIFDSFTYLHSTYVDYENKSSTVAQSIPALTTYCTFLGLICGSTNVICRGCGATNGMKNPTWRFIFQLFFAIRCSLKVFLLFAIELVGFPVLAGLMIDLSLISPCLQEHSKFLFVGTLNIWVPSIWALYWSIGTSYMFWFAKYVGMVRNYIIRPGVLFFIRSSDDPNIRILHDSLIQPMRIQISRLTLSMGIYAMFIIIGFGFHTRVLFPVVLHSNVLPFADQESLTLSLIGLSVLNSNLIMDFNKTFKLFIRQYWTKVFGICCGKLRLSSFILDKDISTERGYVMYRNVAYKLFFSERAKWSNPELYLDPKTPSQARELFKTQNNIHAYFIPNGVLMRVPANDIISRNYVQTLFVPVTKDNKLLKPLDIEAIKERNKEVIGEFSHLDDQSTEFDAYSRVYTPPNFRLRYSSLIFLIWLFASLLFIGLGLLFNLIGRITLLGLLYPFVRFQFVRGLCVMYKNLFAVGLVPVVVGASVFMIGLELYQELRISRFLRDQHAVEEEQQEQAREEAREDQEGLRHPVEHAGEDEGIPLWNRLAGQQKNIMSCLIGFVGAAKFVFVLDYNFSTIVLFVKLLLRGNSPTETRQRFFMTMTFTDAPFDLAEWKSIEVVLFACWLLSSLLVEHKAFFSALMRERDDETCHLLRKQLRTLLTECLTTAGLIIPLQLTVCAMEYASNGDYYSSILSTFDFLLNSRGLTPASEMPWTMLQMTFYLISPVICARYYLTGLLRSANNFLHKSISITKEEVYGRGRTLTNLPEDIEL